MLSNYDLSNSRNVIYREGGKEQLQDEIKAYNLVPKERACRHITMFEIDNEKRRKDFLNSVGGIENKIFIKIGDRKVFAKPEEDTERTSEDGKASSIHFYILNLTKI